MRLLRQDWGFNRPPGKLVKMRFILDEACFLRIKQAPYYQEQMWHLLKVVELESVEIYVLPMDRGIYHSLKTPYLLMSFGGPYTPELVYLESEYGARYIDDRRAVGRFREVASDTMAYVVRVEEYLQNVEL